MMSAHIALPKIEPDNLPATLSPNMLTGVLRGRAKVSRESSSPTR